VPVKDKVIKRKPWEDEEIIIARKALEQAKLKYQFCRTPDNKVAAAEAAKHLSELYVSKENLYYYNLSLELMVISGDHQYSEIWRQIDKISGRKARKQHVINADSDEERVQLWVSHFTKLLSPTVAPEKKKVVHNPVFPGIHLPFNAALFTIEEIQVAVSSLECGKVPGIDGMINEILKINDFHPILLDIINQAYVSKKVPLEWLMSVLIPVFKKGDSTDPNNYRGIALMCVCAKLYNK
jgi:hypothetical protein